MEYTDDKEVFGHYRCVEETVEDVPVESIFGLQDSIGWEPNSEGHTFIEALFIFIHGKCKDSDREWTEEVFHYFVSSQNLPEYHSESLTEFGLPGARWQLKMARYGDKYYCENGKHRLIPGMFHIYYLKNKEGHSGCFKNVKVKVFE